MISRCVYTSRCFLKLTMICAKCHRAHGLGCDGIEESLPGLSYFQGHFKAAVQLKGKLDVQVDCCMESELSELESVRSRCL